MIRIVHFPHTISAVPQTGQVVSFVAAAIAIPPTGYRKASESEV
jgi:hypothetical protein